jgi:hypothetical protein
MSSNLIADFLAHSARECPVTPRGFGLQTAMPACGTERAVQLVPRAVGALGDAHLRNGHLRHVHEGLDARWRATAAVLTVAVK